MERFLSHCNKGIQFYGHVSFHKGQKDTYTCSTDKLINASIAIHCSSDVSCNLKGTKQIKSSYLKIPLVQGCNIKVET